MATPVVLCSWSGGIDSTALIAQMLHRGFQVHAITLGIYQGAFARRERRARMALAPALYARGLLSDTEQPAEWMRAFALGNTAEVPRRNRLVIDHLIAQHLPRLNTTDLGLGEYIGADSWLVQDHVGAADADARALAAYIYHEYGLNYRLWTLADFGKSRFKVDRLRMGLSLGIDMNLTTNCLADSDAHCGRCYKCVERAVAFDLAACTDETRYLADPRQNGAYPIYCAQQLGERMRPLPAAVFTDVAMPALADFVPQAPVAVGK